MPVNTVEMNTKIKLIIFDAYGVTISGGYPDTCKFLAKKFKRDWQELMQIMYVKYCNQAAEKKISQQAAWARTIKELNLSVTVQEIKKIHYHLMGVNKAVLLCAKNLKRKYQILLLSKNTRSQFADINRMFPSLRAVFGKNIINTWEYNLPKASAEAINLACRKFRATPRETIIIDDHESNLTAARGLGARAILYKTLPQFKKELSEALSV